MSWLIMLTLSPLWLFTITETAICLYPPINSSGEFFTQGTICDWERKDFRRVYCRGCPDYKYIPIKSRKTDNYIKKLARKRILHKSK